MDCISPGRDPTGQYVQKKEKLADLYAEKIEKQLELTTCNR